MNFNFKNKVLRRFIGIVSAMTVAAGIFPFSALTVLADTTATAGDFSITYSSGGAYTYADHILTITSGGTYTIGMASGVEATTSDRIIVSTDSDVKLTISSINVTSTTDSPFRADSGNLTLVLEGDNYLDGKGNYAGLTKESTSYSLKITSCDGDGETEGSLTAVGGSNNSGIGGGAGIGGGYGSAGNNIEIAGGTVNATGGNAAAGIGGTRANSSSTSSNITITGGIVSAKGGSDSAACIGGGYLSNGSNITITGGYISLIKGQSSGVYVGSYIGGGASGSGSNITISGGYFGYGSTADNSVYNVTISSGCMVFDNIDAETSSTYPFCVDMPAFAIETASSELTNGTDYIYASNGVSDRVLTILTGGEYTIKMNESTGITKTSTDRIVINSSDDVELTIKDINVTSSVNSPLSINSGNVALTLEGDNYLTSTASQYAALTKAAGSNTLKITGSGSLTANGGQYGAGIGGGFSESADNITISGGTVTAAGGTGASGIGGGAGGSGTDITISGGTVSAAGGSNGAAIGGGISGSGSNITISDGYITLTKSNTSAAYIGGGSDGTTDNITITGGYFGSGSAEDSIVYDTSVSSGFVVLDNSDSSTNSVYPVCVTMPTDLVITSTNGSLTAGTDYTYLDNVLTILSGGEYTVKMNTAYNVTKTETDRIVINSSSAITLTISGINITSSSNSPLTVENGNVYLILDGSNYISSTASYCAALSKASSDTVLEISGSDGSLTAEGGSFAAGIGGSNITITGGTINASGGQWSAGIGGGFESSVSSITICGGTINATGSTGAAAIGGGYNGSGSSITITDGYLTLTRGSDAADYIGAGTDGTAENILITGGYFANGSISDNLVYNITPDSDYYVAQNTYSATSTAYPYRVRKYPDFNITGSADIYEDEDYTYDNDGVLTILKSGIYTVTMADGLTSTDTDRIVVNADGDVTLTISDIDVTSSTESPISADSGNLTLVLKGSSTLTATGENYAGLSKKTSITLKITSVDGDGSTNGSLTATGGNQAAGIGGDRVNSGSNITIAGGTVTAASGQYGAGIGGGRYTNTKNITISGGIVTASSSYGSGIGSGQASDGSSTGSNISISGGTVTSLSSRGAGIGGGYSSTGSSIGRNITISGGIVTASSSTGAGIGSGANYSGSTTASSTASGITISGGTITASGYYSIGCGSSLNGSSEAAVIDGGSVKAVNGFAETPVNSNGEELTLYIVTNSAEGEEISINGKIYVENVVYHSDDDTNQYIYVTTTDLMSLYSLGDVDEDGDVDKADAALLLRYISGITDLTESQLNVSDCNTNQSIDITDVNAILKYLESNN